MPETLAETLMADQTTTPMTSLSSASTWVQTGMRIL